MSDGEMALDTLAALKEFQQAKAELAHIERKLKRFYAACREMGRNAEAGCFGMGPRVANGRLEVGFTDSHVSEADLMNAHELRALLMEQQSARERYSKALDAKNTFGITLS